MFHKNGYQSCCYLTEKLVCVSKHPKSTKYGRQNPIAEKWNSDEQIVIWRKAWADATNAHLERAGAGVRIDHRSYAERGLDEQPTIHEGVVARALEKKGIIVERCETNRQIKADNALLRELKNTVRQLMQAVKNTVPAMAEKLESVLHQYRELKSQATEFDAEELTEARLELRPGMDRSTVSRIQTAYDTQYSPFIMAEARRHISQMLDEHDEESCSIRERLRNHQQAQSDSRGKEKDINR